MKTPKFTWPLLVGWALMVPYNWPTENHTPNLQTWWHMQSSDSAKECEEYHALIYKWAEETHNSQKVQISMAQCVPMELIYKGLQPRN